MTTAPPPPLAAAPLHPWARLLAALVLGVAAALFAADAACVAGSCGAGTLRHPSLGLLQPTDWIRLVCCLAGAALSASLAASAVAGAVAVLPGRAGRWGRSVGCRGAAPLLRRALALAATTWASAPALAAMAAPTPAVPAYVLATTSTNAPPASGGDSGTQPPLPDPTLRPDGATDRVLVRPGDCLWTIAADRLGPGADSRAIAQAWPRWFGANRHLIADPDLIYPGQLLGAPTQAGGGTGR